VSIESVAAVIDTFVRLDIMPSSILAQHGSRPGSRGDERPTINIWVTHRTEFEKVCAEFGAKPKEGSSLPSQRQFYADHYTDDRRLLIQCCSFKHHDDWADA
jgi:hypothetical protein